MVIEAPHQKHDTRTGVFSSEIFRQIGARAFLLAGTHRCANTASSSCSGTTTTCNGSGPFKVSDMAHTDQSFFQVFHEEASNETAGTRVIQVHGFSSDPEDPEFTISDGTTTDNPSGTYLPNQFTSVLESKIAGYSSKGGNSCNLAGDLNLLCGTWNTQGRYTNGVPSADACDTAASSATGLFLHAELSYDLRHTGGTVEPSTFIDTVLEVFSCSPTLVELTSFTATGQLQSVFIQWTTASEIDNAGFHMWRGDIEDGEYTRIRTLKHLEIRLIRVSIGHRITVNERTSIINAHIEWIVKVIRRMSAALIRIPRHLNPKLILTHTQRKLRWRTRAMNIFRCRPKE